MFENPRRGRQATDFTTNAPKILDLKSSSEQIFSENCGWVPQISWSWSCNHAIEKPDNLEQIEFYSANVISVSVPTNKYQIFTKHKNEYGHNLNFWEARVCILNP